MKVLHVEQAARMPGVSSSFLASWLQADALACTEVSTSSFLTGAYCIFLPLSACLRLKQPPGTRVVVATLMVLAGTVP
jgi:hypothetical protein